MTVVAVWILPSCKSEPVAEDEPWDFPWTSIDTKDSLRIDGRSFIGAYDLEDMHTQDTYEVFLLFDSGTRGGMSMIPNSYTLTAFFRTGKEAWQSEVVANGTRVFGFTTTSQTENELTLRAAAGIIWLDVGDDLENEIARRQALAPSLSIAISNGQPVTEWHRPDPVPEQLPEQVP